MFFQNTFQNFKAVFFYFFINHFSCWVEIFIKIFSLMLPITRKNALLKYNFLALFTVQSQKFFIRTMNLEIFKQFSKFAIYILIKFFLY